MIWKNHNPNRAPLALGRDRATALLPVIMAIMSFLSVLAAGGFFGILTMTGDWNNSLTGKATVEIPYQEGMNMEQASEEVMKILLDTPGVITALPVGENEIRTILTPWIGDLAQEELPLPRLIDFTISEGQVDLAALEARLRESNAAIRITGAQATLQSLQRLAVLIRTIAALAALSLIGIAALTALFATRALLAGHRRTIGILHLIGATDRYIAAAFQNVFFTRALAGALPGALLGAIILWLTAYAFERMDATLLPAPWPGLAGWIAVALMPALIALITSLTARLAVLSALRREEE